MSSSETDGIKEEVLAYAKKQILKLDKFGVFILVAWAIGSFAIHLIQSSLDNDPCFRRIVILIGLVYFILFPILGVKIYASLDVMVKNNDDD